MIPVEQKVEKLCQNLYTFIKKDILGSQIRDFFLEGSKDNFLRYLKDIKDNFKIRIDPHHYIFEALSYVLLRPCTVISSLEIHKKDPIRTFRPELTRPPFYFLLYQADKEIISKCAFLDKSECFDMKQMRGCFEIVSYFCKTIPKQMRSYHILEIEILGLVYALTSFRKLIGTSEVWLICDNKAMFWLYNSSIGLSADKIARWGHSIIDNFPQLQILFCRSEANLADVLTRNFGVKTPNLKLTRLERKETSVSDDLWDIIDGKTFSIDQWKTFVSENSHLMILPNKAKVVSLLSSSNINSTICSIAKPSKALNKSFSHLVNLKSKLDIVKERISSNKIIEAQRDEFNDLYQNLILTTNFEYTENNTNYQLKDGIIYIQVNDMFKILVPEQLESILIGFYHISLGHAGAKRLALALDPYYRKGLITRAKLFAHCCLSCLLNNPNTSVEKFAYFPAPEHVFGHIQFDFVQDLPPKDGYRHLIIMSDLLSGIVLCYPMKTKQSQEFPVFFTYNIFQVFKTQYIYMDNDSTFIAPNTLKHLIALGIEVAHTTSRNAFSHGVAEAGVKKVKTLIRKFTSSDNDLNWLFIPALITSIYNTTLSPKHNLKPFQFLFGDSNLSKSYFDILNSDVVLHPVVKHSQHEIETLKQEWKTALQTCAKSIDKSKIDRNKRLNKTKKDTDFEEYQTIFIKRSDSSGPQSIYEKSPYKVLAVRKTTLLCVRLSDGFCTVIHKNWAKKFDNRANSIFKDLPSELLEICNKVDPDELNVQNLNFLLTYDSFELPTEISNLIGSDFETILRKEYGQSVDVDDTDNPTPGPSNQ